MMYMLEIKYYSKRQHTPQYRKGRLRGWFYTLQAHNSAREFTSFSNSWSIKEKNLKINFFWVNWDNEKKEKGLKNIRKVLAPK